MSKPARNHRDRSSSDDRSSPNHRVARLELTLLNELNLLLRSDISDPALLDITIHAVNLSGDLHTARIHYHLPEGSTPGDARAAQLALEHASGFLRGDLADSLDLKRIPILKFVYAPGSPQEEDEKNAWWK